MKPRIKKRSEYCGDLGNNLVRGDRLKVGHYYRTPRTGGLLLVVEEPPGPGWQGYNNPSPYDHYAACIRPSAPRAYYFKSNAVYHVKPDRYYESVKVTIVLEEE